MEGLLPRVSPDSDGLLTMNDYSRTVPVHRYGSTLPKIVLKFPDGTIDRYAHLLVLVHDSLFKLDYYSDSRACLSTRLFGNHSVSFYVDKENHEIILTQSGMMNVKTFNAPIGMIITIETFKDGNTPPTEEDGTLVKEE